MIYRKIRSITTAASAVLVAGCATAPGQPSNALVSQIKEAFASDDPCSDNARNIGIAGGAILGMVIGNSAGNGKSGSVVVGAVLGSLVGGLIGSDIDRKRCELSKIAKQFDLDLTFSAIDSSGEVLTGENSKFQAAGSYSADKTVIGSTVTVRDKDGAAGHFESGSDQLTPKAREYFAAIGAQYSVKNILAAQSDPKRKEEAAKQLALRRIFLIGHTDDTGSSDLNASLSERRAKAVASYLKQQGIPEDSLYFQGAGETLPVADNRTETGRAVNRRVEIVEVADEAIFKKYLEARKPSYQFYRAANSQESNAKVVVQNKPTSEPTAKPITKAMASNVARSPLPSNPTVKPLMVNFGGTPYSPQTATLNVGALVTEKSGFSLMSKAYASDAVVMTDCTTDRPRAAGSVKSLRDSAGYKTSEHMPQLFGKTWADNVNGNLVVINRLAILRDGGKPANLPELKVYSQYSPTVAKKPVINEEPRVNSYVVGDGILYRIFPSGEAGLKCMDLLFATDGATSAKGGKLVYTADASNFVANIKPQVQP